MSATIAAPLNWVEAVGSLHFPTKADRGLQELMDRNNEGLLQHIGKERTRSPGGIERAVVSREGRGLTDFAQAAIDASWALNYTNATSRSKLGFFSA